MKTSGDLQNKNNLAFFSDSNMTDYHLCCIGQAGTSPWQSWNGLPAFRCKHFEAQLVKHTHFKANCVKRRSHIFGA